MPYIDVLPAKSAIFDYWKDRLPKLGIFIDWGEPSCWACGFFLGATTRYDIKQPDAGWARILECWNKIVSFRDTYRIKRGHPTRKGSTMRKPSSRTMPCCMSSDHSRSQPACSATAAIIASSTERP